MDSFPNPISETRESLNWFGDYIKINETEKEVKAMAFTYNARGQEFIDRGYGSDRAYEICLDQEGGDRFDEEKKNERSRESEERK